MQAQEERYLAIGLSVLALRQALLGAGDGLLALQYLLFGLDVNDPQVSPLLEEHGVSPESVPPLEEYVSRRLRPWLRQIDTGCRRSADWTDHALSYLRESLAQDEEARAWALETWNRSLAHAGAETLEDWRRSLSRHEWPPREAIPWLASLGLLEEVFGARLSPTPEKPWRLTMGDAEGGAP